MIAEKKKGR